MAEAQKGFAVLEEVDEGPLERFIEWAYKGCYTAADFELKASSPPSPVSSTKEECETTEWMQEPLADPPLAEPEPPTLQPLDWDLGNFKSAKKSKEAKTRQELKASFIRREHTVRREMISVPPTRANRGANEDYTEPLKTLALEELHDTLATYTLYRGRTGDILALLRYVYVNTGESARGGEDLRMLLRDYLEYEMNVLMKDREFKVLMVEDGGPLLGDFIKMVAKRID